MAASKASRNSVAALVVGLALAALVVIWHAHRQQTALATPITLSRAAEGWVWVHLHDTLHALDARGERVARIADAELALPAPVLHLHAVTHDDLLVAAGSPPRLLRCTLSQRACREVDHGYRAKYGAFKNKVWIGANADGSRVVVSDNAAHRVAMLDGEGTLLADGAKFEYPGQAVWADDGYIWLAHSERERIEGYRPDSPAGTFAGPERSVALAASDPTLNGRDWPMALEATGDGGWWVIVKTNYRDPGGLVRLNAAGRFDRDVNLPAGADLTALTRLGDALVAADLEGPRLHRISLDGLRVESFGSDAFQAELRAHGAALAQWGSVQRWATGALIGLPLLGALLLWRMGEKVGPEPLFEPLSDAPHASARRLLGTRVPVRIEVSPKYRRDMTRMTWIGYALFAGVFVWFWVWELAGDPLLLAMGLIVLVVFVGMVYASHRAMRAQLSAALMIDGDELRLERGGVERARVRLSEVWTDGERVLIGAEVISLAQRRKPIFDADAVREYLLAAIPRERWVSASRLGWLMTQAVWRHKPGTVLVPAVLFAAVLALQLVPKSAWTAAATWLAPYILAK